MHQSSVSKPRRTDLRALPAPKIDTPAGYGGLAAPAGYRPADAVFSADDLNTQERAVPVGVHTGGHQGLHVDDPAAFAARAGSGQGR